MIILIPARLGSKRIPSKNFIPFCGSTLVDIAVSQAEATGIQTFVTTDNQEWKPKSSNITVIKRPESLSDDFANTWDAAEHFGYTQNYFGKIILLQPTSPLRTVEDILTCCKLTTDKNQNVTSVHKSGGPNGAIYIRSWKKWDIQGIEYRMPWARSCDIDLGQDLEAAETLLADRVAKAAVDAGYSH